MQIMCKWIRIAPILNTWTWPLGQNLQKLWCDCLFAAELSFGEACCQDEWVFLRWTLPPTSFCLGAAESVGQSLPQMMVSLTFHDTSNKIICQGNWKAPSLGWQVKWATWIFRRTNWPFLSWMLIRNKWDQSYSNYISTSFRAVSESCLLLLFFFISVPFYSPFYLIYCPNGIRVESFNFVSEWDSLPWGL